MPGVNNVLSEMLLALIRKVSIKGIAIDTILSAYNPSSPAFDPECTISFLMLNKDKSRLDQYWNNFSCSPTYPTRLMASLAPIVWSGRLNDGWLASFLDWRYACTSGTVSFTLSSIRTIS